MPHTVNGIGTWYWGRKNIHSAKGACEFCQAMGELTSYDTTLYVVFLFIPLIPLGKKRVLFECPACRRHRVLSLKAWEDLKRKKMADIFQALQQNPRDLEKGKELIQTTIAYQDRKTFLAAAEVFKQHLGANAEIQALLGEAYTFFIFPAEAETACRAALALQDTPEIRQRLAVNLIKQMRPEEARPYLEHLFDRSGRERVGLLYLLVEGFQGKGMHHEALEILDRCLKIFPEFEKDNGHKKYRQLSEKHQAKGKAIPSANLSFARKHEEKKGEWSSRLAGLIGPAVALLAFAAYLWVAWSKGESRGVYLVNGLDRDYVALVNGQKRRLPAKGYSFIEVKEGMIQIRVQDEKVCLQDQTIRLETPFWSRPFFNYTFVINPDRIGLLVWEQTEYSLHPPKDAKRPYHLHVGANFYEFRGVDYFFTEFPKSAPLSSNKSRVKKERVYQVSQLSPVIAISLVTREAGPEAAKVFLRNRALGDPEDDQSLYLLTALMKPEERVELFRSKLGQRPVLIEWHRAYQTAMGKAHLDRSLETEYRGYLDHETTNSSLIYLLGRVTENDQAADALYQQAKEGNPPCDYALYALAFRRLESGEFDEASDLIHQLSGSVSQKTSFQYLQEEVLLASKKYDDLLALNRESQKRDPVNGELVAREIWLRSLKQQPQEARKAGEDYCKRIEADGTPQTVEYWRKYFDAFLRYSQGDGKGYGEALSGIPGGNFAFESAFCAGKLEEASDALKKAKRTDPYLHLLLFLAAQKAEKKSLADEHLQLAVADFAKGDKEERRVGEWLGAKRTATPDLVCRANLVPIQKRIFLAVMGMKSPSDQASYYRLARKLNYHPEFPYLFLREILGPDASLPTEGGIK